MEGTVGIHTLSGSAKNRVTQQLRSLVCVCGQRKAAGFPFCINCKNSLSPELRRDLRLMLTDTFVESYHEAERYLMEMREKKMWKRRGTFDMQDMKRTFERWGNAAMGGGMIAGTAILATILINTWRTRRGETAWTGERKTA